MMIGKGTVARLMSLVFLAVAVRAGLDDEDYSEAAGKKFLEKLNEEMSKRNTESTQASWDYESNITDATLQHQLEVSKKMAKFAKESWEEVIKYPWQTFVDADTRRQFQKYSFLGAAALSADKYERLEKLVKDMQGVYGKARICDYHNSSKCDLQLEPEITELMAKSRDPNELKHLWTEWRKASGKNVRCMYTEYVNLMNEAARLNNFTDSSQSWLRDYESEEFTEEVERLWQQVRPLYVQLHAYVRRRLRERYGEEEVSKTGPIPAHLLGNVWAQTWSNILNDTVPYPDKQTVDVTSEMIAQNYTPKKMFEVAEEFFTSLGLSPMPDTFWKNSIIEKPKDGRDLICHASAWDFYDGKDFRIKQCTRVNEEDLETVHHEMGHIQYYLQYKHQPFVYKEGANPGFHEAVGDVMALSVSTPKHLKKIGLLKDVIDDEAAEINQLYGMALDKVAFLPFAYLMDQWRWRVFQGKITDGDYNGKWWEFREQYQGMQPPTKRTEDDFDPGAKYHIVASVPYIRYFVSFIIQFQFHRSLCIASGEFDPGNPGLKPLHKCDIYQNKEAGKLLGDMLKMGSSKPWPDAMEAITGQRKMDAGALLQYFSTLQTWLERENARTGEYIGWEPSTSICADDKEYILLEEPHDSFEDDNLGDSYAELVPQNDNSFDVPGYQEKLEPFLHSVFRRATENEFEMNEVINVKLKKVPTSASIDKLVKISAEQRQKAMASGSGKLKGRPVRDRAGEESALKVEGGDSGGGKYGILHDGGKGESKEPSRLTKLLATIGSSMARSHVDPSGGSSSSNLKTQIPTTKSDILWDSEVMRLQAEKMLQNMEETSIENKYNLMLDRDKNGKDYASRNQVDWNVPPPLAANPPPSLWPRLDALAAQAPDDDRDGTPQESSQVRPPVADDSRPNKALSKKSYIHFRYNLRTPVYYNSISIKKPKINTWVDEEPTLKNKGRVSIPDVPETVVGPRVPPISPNKLGEKWGSIKLVPIDQTKLKRPEDIVGDRNIYRSGDDVPRSRKRSAVHRRKLRPDAGPHLNIRNHFQYYSNVMDAGVG